MDATKQKAKSKDKFIGLPPNKRYCLTSLARHKVTESRIVVFGTQTISSPHHGFIRQSYFLSSKMLHALLSRKLKSNIPFLHIDDNTNSPLERSTKNDRTCRIAINIKHNEIYGYIVPICNNKNIIDPSHRFLNSRIRKMQIKRALINLIEA